jgi:protein SCO1
MAPRLMRLLVVLAACAALAACSHKVQWHTDNIDGLVPTLDFHMTDDSGKAVTAQNYRGKIVLLYFGYTNCPDVCPTTLAKLAQALKATKDHGADMQMLFVTVDPKRDSVSRMHAYVRAFDPSFVGLVGTPDELREITKRYRVSYSYGKPDKNGDYEVTHSSAVYVFDGSGRSRLLVTPSNSAKEITADLDQLAAQSGS